MMASPDPKRRRTVPESTPIWLHAEDCTESPEDLQRMRDLVKKDSSLLYNIQLNPPPPPYHTRLPNDDEADFELFGDGPLPMRIEIPPLWHACECQHLTCVQFILQASGPENIKLLEKFSYRNVRLSTTENIFSHCLQYFGYHDKNREIMNCLLDHGISPNVEIDMTEIHNPQILKVLKQYKTTKLIFPSNVFYLAVQHGTYKFLELLFEHGAYPDPVILTESGSILPLYPTLGRHLNPIPAVEHRDVQHYFGPFNPLFSTCSSHSWSWDQVETMKTLLVHGASVPSYYPKKSSTVVPQVLLPFYVIRSAFFRLPSGVRPDGTAYYYHDIALEVVKLYHQFGGDLWWKVNSVRRFCACSEGKGVCLATVRDPNARPCLNLIEQVRMYSNEPETSMLVGEVERMMSTPPSLQHSARLAIRRSMGYGCVRNLEALPLPDRLKKYLKFEIEVCDQL